MPNRHSADPPALARRPALAVVTANAVVMGLVGVSAPIGWILLPGFAAASARPRVAGVVAGWAAVLVAVSVVLPVVPGHRADAVSLATSAIFLAILPALARARESGYGRGDGSGVTAGPVSWSTMRVGPFVVATATTAASRDVIGHVECSDGRLRIVLGVLAGSVSSPRSLVHRLTRQFVMLASSVDRALDELAGELHATIQATSTETHLAATLIEISPGRRIAVLRCGGPEIIALPASTPDSPPPPCVLVDPGPGALPLGLERPQQRDVRELPACARIAIVTSAFATSHYADYTDAVDAALRSKDLALAAMQLIVGPPDPDGWAPVVGPALIIAHQPPTPPQ